MGFLNLRPKILVVLVCYMIMVYTCVYAFSPRASPSGLGKQIPEFDLSSFNVTSEEYNASVREENKQNAGLLGAIIGGISVTVGVLITCVTLGVASPVGVALVAGGLGAIGSYFIGYHLSDGTEVVNVGINDFLSGLKRFLGSIWSFGGFLLSILSFGLFASSTLYIPNELAVVVFLMVLPVWILIMTILSGFAIEVYKAVKIWG